MEEFKVLLFEKRSVGDVDCSQGPSRLFYSQPKSDSDLDISLVYLCSLHWI